jgi:ABC-type uncharacterized transport system substrate-binding protein
MHPLSRILAALPALCLSGFAALAHPHVQVSVKMEVRLDEAGEITAVRHHWTFDEAYSAFASNGLDANKDGKLDREELAPLAQENVESLGEFGFFTFIRKGKDASGFGAAADYFLEHDGKALTLHFTLPVEKQRFSAKEVRLEVYDPSYFVAFEFAKETPVTVEGGKSACTAKVMTPPASVTARLSQMSETFFQGLKNTESSEWSIPVKFECK